jgi:hypothetical protein
MLIPLFSLILWRIKHIDIDKGNIIRKAITKYPLKVIINNKTVREDIIKDEIKIYLCFMNLILFSRIFSFYKTFKEIYN